MAPKSTNPDELISEAQSERDHESELARDALEWFLDNLRGGLSPREDVVAELSDHLGVSESETNRVVGSLVGDIVDPVQQVMSGGEKYIGVIEYRVYKAEGAYGYVDYDDRLGRRNRVVCARCVEQHELDEHITHATQGEGSSPDDASWQDLLNKVTAHYASEHETGPEAIEPGASLVSGTTIAGNTAWHAGNDGSGSTLDADTVDGQEASELGTDSITFPMELDLDWTGGVQIVGFYGEAVGNVTPRESGISSIFVSMAAEVDNEMRMYIYDTQQNRLSTTLGTGTLTASGLVPTVENLTQFQNFLRFNDENDQGINIEVPVVMEIYLE